MNEDVGRESSNVCLNAEYAVNFVATDLGGNTQATSARLVIKDTTPPKVLQQAVPGVHEYTAAIVGDPAGTAGFASWLANRGGLVVDDAQLDGVEWASEVFTFRKIDAPSECKDLSAAVKFTATDPCGNRLVKTTTFSYMDATAPRVVVPPRDAAFERSDPNMGAQLSAWLLDNGGARATDANTFEWSHTGADPADLKQAADACGNVETTVYFVVTDACGRSVRTQATLQLVDQVAPSLTSFASDRIHPDDGLGNDNLFDLTDWLFNNGGATSSEDVVSADKVTWEHTEPVFERFNPNVDFGVCPNRRALVTFTVSDECGNTVQTIATYVIQSAPTRMVQQAVDRTVESDGSGNVVQYQAWLASNGGATVNVASGAASLGAVEWTRNDWNGFLQFDLDRPSDSKSTVMFSALDKCGNLLTTEAGFTIADTTPPSFSLRPLDMTTEAAGDADSVALDAWAATNGGGMATDLSGEVVWSMTSGYPVFLLPGTQCLDSMFTSTFTAEDANKNAAKVTASFFSKDTTAPPISTPAQDVTVESDGFHNAAELAAWLNENGKSFADADLSGAQWFHTPAEFDVAEIFESVDSESSCTKRAASFDFVVTDGCGNSDYTTGRFIIDDTTPPSIVQEAADVVFDADGEGNAADIQMWLFRNANASATDIEGSVAWSFTYTDVLPPALSAERPNWCQKHATATEVAFVVTDLCGNKATTTATVAVADVSPPTWTTPPSDKIVSVTGGMVLITGTGQGRNDILDVQTKNTLALKSWLASGGSGVATDISGNVTLDYAALPLFAALDEESNCLDSFIDIQFSATDGCGQSADAPTTARFIVKDVSPPEFIVEAQENTAEMPTSGKLEDSPEFGRWLALNGNAAVTDGGTSMGDLVWSHSVPNFRNVYGSGCNSMATDITFTVTDGCGNSASTVATFNLVDSTGPTITVEANPITLATNGISIGGAAVRSHKSCEELGWLFHNGHTDVCVANRIVEGGGLHAGSV